VTRGVGGAGDRSLSERTWVLLTEAVEARAAATRYAAEVGADFELEMGYHLGLIEETNGAE
jgi:hypothetical protein